MEDNLDDLSISFRILSGLGIFFIYLYYVFLGTLFIIVIDSDYSYRDYVHYVCMTIFNSLLACIPDILAVVKFKKNKMLIDYSGANESKAGRARVRTVKRIFIMSIVRMVFLLGLAVYCIVTLREIYSIVVG